jgi:hypothetical protein
MSPKIESVEDWGIGIDVSTEKRISQELLLLFNSFWIDSSLEEKSKQTKSRYRSALHALGGYIVEQLYLMMMQAKAAKSCLLRTLKIMKARLFTMMRNLGKMNLKWFAGNYLNTLIKNVNQT